MSIELILKYKHLIAELLEIAADRFSTHCCNDFDLTKTLPDRADRHELAKIVWDEDDPDRCNLESNCDVMADDELMSFFADKIRNL